MRLLSRVFTSGFFRGLAAPLLLFPDFAPTPRRYVEIQPRARRTDAESLANDWRKVGADIRTAMDKQGHSSG